MSATVTPFGTPGTVSTVNITNGIPNTGTGTVSTLDNIFNATNGPIDVKAASTAAVAGDKALVVAISPNGQNLNGRKAATASAPVVLATEDLAALQMLSTTALTNITLAADAVRTDTRVGLDGVQITRPHTNLESIVSGRVTDTTGSSTVCIAAQAAGIRTYISSIVLCNTSTSALTVDILDGSTIKVTLPLPAGSGCIYNPPVPLRGTAATAWNFDPSGAATTVTCSMIGFASKV